jgi:hypothetical protein
MSKKIWRPERGMVVRITDDGFRQFRPRNAAEARAAVEGVPVVGVSLAYTEPEVYNVDLAAPLDWPLLTSLDVELVR